jgi:hypothetical protein
MVSAAVRTAWPAGPASSVPSSRKPTARRLPGHPGPISCTLPRVGDPVPISRNWQIPALRARNRTARARNAQFSRTTKAALGAASNSLAAASRSAAK